MCMLRAYRADGVGVGAPQVAAQMAATFGAAGIADGALGWSSGGADSSSPGNSAEPM